MAVRIDTPITLTDDELEIVLDALETTREHYSKIVKGKAQASVKAYCDRKCQAALDLKYAIVSRRYQWIDNATAEKRDADRRAAEVLRSL